MPNTAPTRVFRTPHLWSSLLGIAGAMGFVVIVILWTTPELWWLALALFGLGLGIVLMVDILCRLSRLELSPTGIRYLVPGYRVACGWDEVTGYGCQKLGADTVDVLRLRYPALEMGAILGGSSIVQPCLAILSVLNGRVAVQGADSEYAALIPVGLFDPLWRAGEIGALVKQYAPQAFATRLDAPEQPAPGENAPA